MGSEQGRKGRRPGLHPNPHPLSTITVAELTTRFLGWLERHRSHEDPHGAARHLRRFRDAYGAWTPRPRQATQLEAFTETLRAEGHADEYVNKHVVSVKAMVNRGVKMGWLPKGSPRSPRGDHPCRRQAADWKPICRSTDEVKASWPTPAYGQMGDVIRSTTPPGQGRTNCSRRPWATSKRRPGRSYSVATSGPGRCVNPIPGRSRSTTRRRHPPARRCEGRDAGAPIFPRPSDGTISNVRHRRAVPKRAAEGGRPGRDHDLQPPSSVDYPRR